MLDSRRIELAAAAHRCIGKSVRVYDEIDSTNAEALRLADLAEGAALIADFQTQGRGRAGKKWHAAKGENLLFSIALRPQSHRAHLGLLSLLAAEAVAETVETLAQQPAEIKYPNDVLVWRKKIAGVLVEARSNSSGTRAVALGIGLNVNQTEFHSDLPATSLKLVAGKEFDRAEALIALLKRLDEKYHAFQQGDTSQLLREWKARCAMLGKVVVFRHEGRLRTGRAIDVDEAGFLWIESDGERVRYAQTEVSDVRY